MKPFFRSALLVSLAWTSATFAGAADRSTEVLLIRVTIVDRERELPHLQRLELDVAGSDWKEQTVDVVGDRGVYETLRRSGFLATIARDLSVEALSNPLSDYMNPVEVNARIDAIVAAHPSIAQKIQYATTFEGRPVYALKISDNVASEDDEPALFFIAQHHAREVMTPEIAIDIAEQLTAGYGSDPRITQWVDGREIFVLPNHNPDGSNHVFDHAKSWRKNRRDNGDGSFGVDPNRNYAFKWNSCGGSSGVGDSDNYRGPSPASEPETSGIAALAHAQRPILSLSYHTYGEQVLMPYACAGVYASENAVLRRLASDIASRLVGDNGLRWYKAGTTWEILYAEDGDTDAWFYGDNGTYAFEIEASSSSQGFQPVFTQWRDSTVLRQRPAWQYLLDRPDGPGISGHVTDACTGAPVVATMNLDEVVFVYDEVPRMSEPLFGRYQWLTGPGTFHARATKSGYTAQVWPVTVGTSRVERPVRLVPSGSNALAVSHMIVEESGSSLRLRVSAINTGASTVTAAGATLTTSDPYVTITDASTAYGSIAPGAPASGDDFIVSIAPGAPDEHAATLVVNFAADQALCSSAEAVTLRITIGHTRCLVTENLDTNPGWTIDNSTTAGWAFGPPQGNGGANGPAASYSGINAYGTNLSGLYANSADYKLITTSYDLRRLRHAELRYQRWLDNEPGADIASVDVSTDGGTNWQPLTSAFGYGEGWQPEVVDISSLADLQPRVRFRFRLRSDAANVRSGFYLDDLQVCGEDVTRAPNGLGATLMVARAGDDLQLDWVVPAVDATHDAATGYRVYRSDLAASGFAVAAQPVTNSVVLVNELATSAQFYLAVAENFGGVSPDGPSP